MNSSEATQRVVASVQLALGSALDDLSAAERSTVVMNIASVVAGEVARERQRCVEVCRSRVELWRNTLAAKSSVASAREEARARANEAHYLADVLEAGDASDEAPDA